MTTEDIRLEEDRLRRWPVIGVIFASVVIMAFSIWLAWWLLVVEERAILGSESTPRPAPAPNQISGVRQTMIQYDREGVALRRNAEESLERYLWIDRDRGLVRIPIRRAMELRARGVRP